MASVNAEKPRPHRRSWKKSIHHRVRRLFCCSCLPGEEMDPLQEQDKNINGCLQHQQHLDEQGPGEKEAIQITVEDLGIVNTSFMLFEEDPLILRNSVVRSASSASACPRALKKKRLKPLYSLPIMPQAKPVTTSSSRGNEEEEEEDMLLYESGTNSTAASESLLTQPVINLIPPTPSDVTGDDQFFDINSEESVAQMSGSDESLGADESYEEKMERAEVDESTEKFTLAENNVSADSAAQPEEEQSDQFGKIREALPTTEGAKETTQPEFLRSASQVAPLAESFQKSELSVL